MGKVLERVEKMIGKHIFASVKEDILPPRTGLSIGDSVADYDLAIFRLRFQQSMS